MDYTVKKLKTSLIVVMLKNHTLLLESIFGNPKLKHNIIESKEGKIRIEDKEIADRWKQYDEELYDDPDELEELEREEEITPEELSPTITKAEFEKAVKELKSKKHTE